MADALCVNSPHGIFSIFIIFVDKKKSLGRRALMYYKIGRNGINVFASARDLQDYRCGNGGA